MIWQSMQKEEREFNLTACCKVGKKTVRSSIKEKQVILSFPVGFMGCIFFVYLFFISSVASFVIVKRC